MPRFSVDTHLFRELGALLVGRDSTALVELIKNSYDADATKVTVYGTDLAAPEVGMINLIDDGVGMTPEQFENGFLRIASRSKEQGDRRSALFQRRFTGAKGIGRLAAHKLAATLELHSVPIALGSTVVGVDARINWDAIEELETLDDLEGADEALQVTPVPSANAAKHGTSITLRRLRRGWSGAERGRFLTEVQTFSAAPVLIRPLAESVLSEPLLFPIPDVRDTSAKDPGFQVELEGDLAGGDDYWQALAEVCTWVIEIEATPTIVRFGVAPTNRTAHARPDARRRIIEAEHPLPAEGPFFQARILVREGRLPGPLNQWASRLSGVRVYLEGFRVLPYGERSNDWLSLDSDYARRTRTFAFEDVALEELGADAALQVLPNASYFGAVFLTENRARSLRMLVNREGFVPDPPFNVLTELVRRGISLSVRARSALAPVDQKTKVESSEAEVSSAVALRRTLGEALTEVNAASSSLVRGAPDRARESVGRAEQLLGEAADQADGLISETAMLRVLASVGTQMAAFVHEVNGLVSSAEAVETTLDRLSMNPGTDVETRQKVLVLKRSMAALRQGLDRQASYLVDVLAKDARRRRSKQPLAERISTVLDLLSPSIEQRSITVTIDVSSDLVTPSMFRAELVALLVNLVSNAVKAAGPRGRIHIAAKDEGGLALRVENTGKRVRRADRERWFRPFESTTEAAEPLLGQGMGMGLPISRRIVSEYSGSVRFVPATRGFATAIEVRLPR
jgi:signal transduction histidine kinase